MGDKLLMGILGTAISATGAAISATELQAIISIIITVAGFLISVVIPYIYRLVKKIKEAKKDGVITEEEKKDIIDTAIQGGKEVVEGGKEIVESLQNKEESEKSEGE